MSSLLIASQVEFFNINETYAPLLTLLILMLPHFFISKKIKESFCSESLSEEETKSVIKEVYKNQKMLIDPHTAVAIGAVNKISLEGNTVILATAHPSKFSDVVMKETGIKPELPENLKNILDKKEKYEKMSLMMEEKRQKRCLHALCYWPMLVW